MGINIFHSDAVKWATEYAGPKFHALLCDPPYHLTSIVKRFGKGDSAPAQFGKDGAFSRASRGFMGKQWDGGDVAFDPETWATFANVLHPGAFGMAFASSRGWHRLACAIEDGGLIIHPSIFGWAYGSGFPKATRVKGDERFVGHRYGLQALKPALEPIIVFQKPYEGRPVDNIISTGAGTLNIDGGRIGTEEIPSNQWVDNAHPFGGGAGNEYQTVTNQGRWAANFILMDDGAATALDRQSGNLKSGDLLPHHKSNGQSLIGTFNIRDRSGENRPTYGDEGGASRFFFRVQEAIDSADPVYYEAKASTEERDAGLRNFEIVDGAKKTGRKPDSPGLVGNKEKGYDSNPYANGTPSKNSHPTVKPIELARYLATLLLPPTEYQPRKLFVPFAGVASECIGAMQAGWDDITGVEMTEEYIPIAEARVEYWRNRGWQTNLL